MFKNETTDSGNDSEYYSIDESDNEILGDYKWSKRGSPKGAKLMDNKSILSFFKATKGRKKLVYNNY